MNSAFDKNMKYYVKNPLGIIALFVVTVYLTASIAFSFGLSKLSGGQAWVFLAFMVGFPIVIFFSFVYLVVKHHTKLYSPYDFKDQKHFLALATREEIQNKKQREHDEMKKYEAAAATLRSAPGETTPARTELPKIMRSALDFFAKKYGVAVVPNVKFSFGDGPPLIFDGQFMYNGKINLVDVKYIGGVTKEAAYDIVRRFYDDIINRLFYVDDPAALQNCVFSLAIVHEPNTESVLKEALDAIRLKYAGLTVSVNCIMLDVSKLDIGDE